MSFIYEEDYPRKTEVVLPIKEVRATDSTTGAQKGRKLARFSLLPWDALVAVAEHFGRGAEKYAERNWEGGYPWSWSYDALCRHLGAWWQGEERDAETGSLHITAVAWHALVLLAYRLRGAGTDDRPVALPQPGLAVDSSARRSKEDEPGCKAFGTGDESRFKWLCERPAGHTGDHMAWDDYETRTLYEGGRWPNEKEAQSGDSSRYVSSHAGKV